MDDILQFEVDVPREVLIAAEVLQVGLLLFGVCMLLFVVFCLREAWLARKARVRKVLVDAVRSPASHRVLTSPKLWRSRPGALFREAGRRALSRLAQSERIAGLELLRRALLVEDLIRGRSSWLRLATPGTQIRIWVDVYLDSAVPGLERANAPFREAASAR